MLELKVNNAENVRLDGLEQAVDEYFEFFETKFRKPLFWVSCCYLNDEQIADVRPGQEIAITTLVGTKADVTVHEVEMDISKLSKGGYPHFMLKEIFEQPDCLRDCMRGRVIIGDSVSENRIVLSALNQYHDRLVNAQNVIIVACGTSWHAGLIGKQLIEQLCRRRVEVEYASEFRYSNPVIGERDVVIDRKSVV